MPVVKKHARTSQYCCMFHTFCVYTVCSLMLSLILHEMALLLHENWSYWIKQVWCLCKLQNKNFIRVCCTTLWRPGAGKGRRWKTATVIYCGQQSQRDQSRPTQLSGISSGPRLHTDRDSGALALTKQNPGSSRDPIDRGILASKINSSRGSQSSHSSHNNSSSNSRSSCSGGGEGGSNKFAVIVLLYHFIW